MSGKFGKRLAGRLLLAFALVMAFGHVPGVVFADEAAQRGNAAPAETVAVEQNVEPVENATESAEEFADEEVASATTEGLETTAPLVEAVAAPKAKSYNLYWYALMPDAQMDDDKTPANERWFGIGVTTISGVRAPSNYETGAILDTTGNLFNVSKQQVSASGGYPNTLYPKITYKGVEYTYAAPGSDHEDDYGYYTLEFARLRVSDGANSGSNANNSTADASGNRRTNTFHYDFLIHFNDEEHVDVKWSVQQAGSDQRITLMEGARSVTIGFPEKNLTVPRPPSSSAEDNWFTETQTDSTGNVYVFDGWYEDENFTEKADFTDEDTIETNTTYYGRYVLATGSMSITKYVAGGVANVEDHFTFKLSGAIPNGSYDAVYALDGETSSDSHPTKIEFKDNESVTEIKLRHNETVTIQGLPSGVIVNVKEDGVGNTAYTSTGYNTDGRDVYADYDINKGVDVTVAQDADSSHIYFKNTFDQAPNNGVSTSDITPMVGLLAAAAVGGTALFVAGRRKCGADAWKE